MDSRGSWFWNVLRMMKTLSIPIANTRNGITSLMIGVTETPAAEQMPTEITREQPCPNQIKTTTTQTRTMVRTRVAITIQQQGEPLTTMRMAEKPRTNLVLTKMSL